MKIPTPLCLKPDSNDLSEQLARLNKAAGIYQLSIPGAPPHLSWSTNLGKRLGRLLSSSYTSTGTLLGRLRARVATIDCWQTGSRLESSLLLYAIAKESLPETYRKLLKLRIPWFVGLAAGSGFARTEVVNRIPASPDGYFGPFASRGLAQNYEQELLSLFQIRRCTEALAPSPDHPGCIYGEMNQCLRPCQCAVGVEEYQTEVERLHDFLSSNGRSAAAPLSIARDRAAVEMDFEQAAQLHKRVEKVKATAALRDPVIKEVSRFGGVALTASTDPECFVLWPLAGGCWQEPIRLPFRSESPQAKSLDAELREAVTGSLSFQRTNGNRAEELALFARWYYSSWRDGLWFPLETAAELNYRKLVREISKMASATAPATN